MSPEVVEKAAQTLVKCEYATRQAMNLSKSDPYILLTVNIIDTPYCRAERCEPFYSGKDLERECRARRQADAIEDYLHKNHAQMYTNTRLGIGSDIRSNGSLHQWRLDRIKYCLSELIK